MTGLKTSTVIPRNVQGLFNASIPGLNLPRVVFDGKDALTPDAVAKLVSDGIKAAFAERDEQARKDAEAAKKAADEEKKRKAAEAAAQRAKDGKNKKEDDEDAEDEINDTDDEATRTAKINRRSAKYRLQAKELREKLDKEAEERQKAIDEALNKQRTDNDKRVIKSEAKAALRASGVVNADDALKLLDLSKLSFDEDGEVVGIDTLIADAKKDRPYLFGEVTTGNPSSRVPRPGTVPVAKHVSQMTPEEIAAEEARLTR